MNKCRTLLIDHHPLLIEGLRNLLAPYPDILIVGTANNVENIWQIVKDTRPQLIIMEVDVADGMHIVKRLRSMCPHAKIVVYTAHTDQRFLPELIHMGIVGYVLKRDHPEKLLQAIQEVRKDHVFLSAYDPGGYLIGLMRERIAKPYNENLSLLSKRENEIFLMLAQGMPIRHIATSLHLSPKTIESHKYNLFHKLHITSLSELIKIAIRHGLIQV